MLFRSAMSTGNFQPGDVISEPGQFSRLLPGDIIKFGEREAQVTEVEPGVNPNAEGVLYYTWIDDVTERERSIDYGIEDYKVIYTSHSPGQPEPEEPDAPYRSLLPRY